jgi:hypothetical protein
MNGPPHLLGEVSNTSKTAQLKELRRFLFKRKFIWVVVSRKNGGNHIAAKMGMDFGAVGDGTGVGQCVQPAGEYGGPGLEAGGYNVVFVPRPRQEQCLAVAVQQSGRGRQGRGCGG